MAITDEIRKQNEEYLVAISNKGIVKRANKDLEGGLVCVLEEQTDNTCSLSVGDAHVILKLPLAESECSCPARSICRHIIAGIMYVQSLEVADKEKQKINEEDTTEEEILLSEIQKMPVDTLVKAMGLRSYSRFLKEVEKKKCPAIVWGNVITVPLKKETVKVLYPVQHTSCTCHKKELCAHKAEAFLICKWQKGFVSYEELQTLVSAQEEKTQKEDAKAVLAQVQQFMEELLLIGLSRTSVETLFSLERYAILCHNASLANCESACRSIKDGYEKYFKHATTFSEEILLKKVIDTIAYIKKMQSASEEEWEALVGEFRTSYQECGNLDLCGMTEEEVSTSNGYAGKTVYFLEENEKKWYTYTELRPVFYDNKRKIPNRNKIAPWGLSIPFSELYKGVYQLRNARCDDSGRLSSTKESIAEQVGITVLSMELIQDYYFEDWSLLYQKAFSDMNAPALGKKALYFLAPDFFETGEFIEREQKFRMPIFDTFGKQVLIEVAYTRKEAPTIAYLEKLSKEEPVCFLGRIYVQDGWMKLYPLEVFRKKDMFR